MMPHDSTWAECDSSAPKKQLPTDIDVIPGDSVLWIEGTEFQKCLFSECHIATGHMLGQFVFEENMSGISRRMVDALCEKAVLRRNQIRSANTNGTLLVEGVDEKVKPIPVGKSIAIDERYDLSSSSFDPGVASGAQASIRSIDHSYLVPPRDCSRIVIGSIVDHDDLVLGIVKQGEKVQRFVNCALRVKGRYDNRHARPTA